MESAAVVSLLVFLLVAEAVWLIAPAASTERGPVAERIGSYVVPLWEPKAEGALSVMRRQRHSRIAWLDAFLDRFNLAANLASQLLRAGLPVRAGEFLFLQVAVATVVAVGAVVWQVDRPLVRAVVPLVHEIRLHRRRAHALPTRRR